MVARVPYVQLKMSTLSRCFVRYLSLFWFLLPLLSWGQGLVINEVVSSNQASAFDEDGDTPDWIELFQPGPGSMDLMGYGLSDDPANPFKWVFSDGSMGAGQHLLIFASEKDRQSLAYNWDPLITAGEIWHYLLGTNEPPSSWKSIAFNDDSWSTGPTGIGYGDNDDATIIATTLSFYMRKEFIISDPDDIQALIFHMDVDDGYIAYLNGQEFARQNMGLPGSFKAYNTGADQYTEPLLPYGLDLHPVTVDPGLLVSGTNVLAIQVHNSDINSSDLTALPFLTAGMADDETEPLPDYLILPGGQLMHTNFKLDNDGETLLLTAPGNLLIDSLTLPPLTADISFGRQTDGAPDFYYFNTPTPQAPNTGGFIQLAVAAQASPPPGFYTGSISVTLDLPGDGTIYRYTLDGSEPGAASSLYQTALTLTSTTILRVRSTSPDGVNHHFSTFSYFLNAQHQLPVMSLTFNPGSFFDNDTGIYVLGDHASSEFPYFGANFWEEWERAIHIEYFEDAQELSFAAPGGVQIFGGWSRGNAQRSLSLFARSGYGTGEFKFPFFEERAYDGYQALVLRNSGNDWQASGYRDVFMNDLVLDRNLEHQAFQPVEVYLNGSYWGIYNLREKINEHSIASMADLDPEELDLLDLNGIPIHGTSDQYAELVHYVETHTLGTDAEFEFVRERVDLEDFIDYQFAQIYFDNEDWPGNNIKFWKARGPSGRWRWILFDTDFGFGIWNQTAYAANTLNFALDANGPGWPNPPWSTLFLRKFMNNATFKREFILRGSDLLNWNFKPSTVSQKLVNRRDAMAPGIIHHFERWQHNTVNNWTWQFSVMETFGLQRPAYMRQHMQSRFGLPAPNTLTVQVDPPESGIIKIHSLTPREYPWSGIYFPTVPLDVSAIPAAGFTFSHWEGITSSDPDLLLNLQSSRTLMAVFTQNTGDESLMVINEINYHSSDDEDAKDWVELHNFSSTPVDLEGWYLSDADDANQYIIPELPLGPEGYLVITADSLAFRAIHGDGCRVVGDLGFNLSNGGELIRLFDPLGTLVDSLTYSDSDPWPVAPDGSGPTLELIHPALDNSQSQNWAASDGLGTPGGRNSRWSVPDGVREQLTPASLTLSQAFPNPFNSQVTLPIHLAQAGNYRLQIFDLRGARVLDRQLQGNGAGQYNYHWDGKNELGQDCSSGMYIVKVSQATLTRSLKLALVR